MGLRLGKTRARLRGLTVCIGWFYCLRLGPPCALCPSMALRAFAQFPKLTTCPEFPQFPRHRAFLAETGDWFWYSGRRGGRILGMRGCEGANPGPISRGADFSRRPFSDVGYRPSGCPKLTDYIWGF